MREVDSEEGPRLSDRRERGLFETLGSLRFN